MFTVNSGCFLSHFVLIVINPPRTPPIMPIVSVSLTDAAYGIYLSWPPKMPGKQGERSRNISQCIVMFPELQRQIKELEKRNRAQAKTIETLMNAGDDE
jgi:hypothetical protein